MVGYVYFILYFYGVLFWFSVMIVGKRLCADTSLLSVVLHLVCERGVRFRTPLVLVLVCSLPETFHSWRQTLTLRRDVVPDLLL